MVYSEHFLQLSALRNTIPAETISSLILPE